VSEQVTTWVESVRWVGEQVTTLVVGWVGGLVGPTSVGRGVGPHTQGTECGDIVVRILSTCETPLST
jgi:hypothetical protein